MVKQFNYVAGIDISKKTFDVTISENNFSSDGKFHKVFDNNLKGCKQLIKWLKTMTISCNEVLFCMENTGIYHRFLAAFLLDKVSYVWVETATHIKWSMGIQRGKNDKVDSFRIMEYAKRNLDKAKLYQQRSKDLQQVTDLLAVRKRLNLCIKALKVPVIELEKAGFKDQAKVLEKATRKSLNVMLSDIKKIEKQIKEVIAKSDELNPIYKNITSVKSVGFVAACYLMIYTNSFKKFSSAKQIASYCGIAPFEYSSGSSIKGKTRVNHMANKELKTVLHMCAISSISNNEEMKNYFQRKVDEGKNKMLVINSIRNKLLSRVFSCVKNNKLYTPNLAA